MNLREEFLRLANRTEVLVERAASRPRWISCVVLLAPPQGCEDSPSFARAFRFPGCVLAPVGWRIPSGGRAFNALLRVECEYVGTHLEEIRDKNIEGDLAEFGIYQGWWINFLYETSERLGLDRRVYGFDSFQGLSEPHPEHDQPFWKKRPVRLFA